MMFKTIITFLIMLSWSACICIMDAENVHDKKHKIELSETSHKYKPHDNHTAEIVCYYQGGKIFIEFSKSQGWSTLKITDLVRSESSTSRFHSGLPFNYQLGNQPSTYLLEISTSAGNDYEGYLTID